MGVHIFQKDIIDRLRMTDSLRYSELLPDDVESSHFKYHLDQLIIDKFVEKLSRGVYSLTDKGRMYTDRLSERRVNPHAMPKLITYTLLQDDEHYYLYKKDKEPYRGLVNMIGGKMHIGETPEAASLREVYEKTSLQLGHVARYGVADIRIQKGDTLFSHVTAYIYGAHITVANDSFIAVKKNEVALRSDLAPDLLAVLQHVSLLQYPFVVDIGITM